MLLYGSECECVSTSEFVAIFSRVGVNLGDIGWKGLIAVMVNVL